MSEKSVAFDRAAEYYDDTRGFPAGEAQHVAAHIAQTGGLSADSRLLEIGVGTGRIALPLARHVREMVGLDLARPMMAKLLQKKTDEPIALIEGDATRLPLADHSVDAVLTVHVLHLIPNWRAALAELARVLRPGAPLLYSWGGGGQSELREAWNSAVPEQPAVGVDFTDFDDDLVAAGWRRVGTEAVYTYPDQFVPQKFLDSAKGRMWSRSWRLTDEEVAAGVAAVESYIAAHFLDPTQPVPTTGEFHVRVYLPEK